LVDYNGVKEVRVVGNAFLEIVYDTRGGSGYQLRNTVILSVKKHKINVSILSDSFGKAFGAISTGAFM